MFYEKAFYGLSTLFGLGTKVPAPGTFGSLVGLFFAILLRNRVSFKILYILLGVFFILGCIASEYCERNIFFREDPKEIIVDEFIGMMLVSISINFFASAQVLGFIFFRIFDIYKPYPIRIVEQLTWGIGIMLDDVLAGLLAVIFVYGILYFF